MEKLPKTMRKTLIAGVLLASAACLMSPTGAQATQCSQGGGGCGVQFQSYQAGQTPPASAVVGCDQTTVYPGLSNGGSYTYTQEYSTAYSLVHQPTSYFGCLQGLINEASSLLNMFSGNGFSITGLLTQLAQAAVNELINQLENAVCSAANSVLQYPGGAAAPLLAYLHQTPQ